MSSNDIHWKLTYIHTQHVPSSLSCDLAYMTAFIHWLFRALFLKFIFTPSCKHYFTCTGELWWELFTLSRPTVNCGGGGGREGEGESNEGGCQERGKEERSKGEGGEKEEGVDRGRNRRYSHASTIDVSPAPKDKNHWKGQYLGLWPKTSAPRSNRRTESAYGQKDK